MRPSPSGSSLCASALSRSSSPLNDRCRGSPAPMPIEKAERPRPVELLSELAAERVPAPPMPAGAAPDTAWKKWWCCDADVDGEGMATGWVVPSALSGSGGGVGRDEVEADDEACDAADAAAANPGESESDAAGETARRLKA